MQLRLSGLELLPPLHHLTGHGCKDLLPVFHCHGCVHARRINREIDGILGQTQTELGIAEHGLNKIIRRAVELVVR